ncbi:MAG: hypothetical protein ABIN36_17655 [Ferruginibacter sp.]
MNKIITGACVIAVCFFSACNEKQPDHDSSLMSTDSLKTSVPTGSESQNTLTTNPAQLPGTTAPATITPLSPDVTKQITATPAAGINPAHGQPGHRCDIAVGAPLNSPATKPATQTVQTVTPTVTPAASTSAKTVTAPGMNPPHGEPGHRCDIAVGAPLNSPATKPAAAPVQTTTPVMSPAAKDSGS